MPTIAWVALRQGIKTERHALRSIVNALIFTVLITLHFLTRFGFDRVGY